ncbi:MAG: hypothetical protein QF637_09945 [Acidimicrobiales bacterium]|nr:hypothetical protein [Acidimicrobiales bacterium]
MKVWIVLVTVSLAAASCSYSTTSEGQATSLTKHLTEQERTCVQERLVSGWALQLSDLEVDLSPDEEIAVDMAMELCRMNTDTPAVDPAISNDQPQVSDELLEAPAVFDSNDNPPGEDPLLDDYWTQCGSGDARACDNLFYSAPPGSAYEQFAFSCGGRRNMDCSLLLGVEQPEGDLNPLTPPPGDDENLDQWWVLCSEGSTSACGELRLIAPSGSLYAQFATSCGARGTSYCTLILEDDGQPPTLNKFSPDLAPPGEDEFLDQLWLLCGAADSRACKDLSKYGPTDSIYVQFGVSCGGRAVAPCPRLFTDLSQSSS